MPFSYRSQRGFSLLQVILGVQLSVIAMAIGVSKLSGFASQFQLMRASSQLAFDITRARAQAIAQNRPMRIQMTSATSYQRQKWNPTLNQWQLDTPTTSATRTFPKGINTTTTTAIVTFETTGFARLNQTNDIVIRNSAKTPVVRTIQTTPVGKVNVLNG